ncbi:FAD/NAD(P)-binding domain-containing protein [Cucurbitaria berberidis CBS 394.84]|uniref:FAD/NAD(P)-binding domain-containing protein n=1 Tax=Cucurbitaria berberidis CBS 394.84 TaxID=1168544 RepID=A0A9P4GMR5_9PLEO|nr:FAD/NAD(P)-binding domain-containing protein [Cucurbitaria berberidis CBS 394.84]KAF1847901.1 FAD/NAD(P)-binding domain-containing protein [Cucurbitaria berberidis CBS 394.84]
MSSKSRLEAISDHLAPSSTIAVEEQAETRTIFPPLELEDHPLDDVRPLRVVVVGAGISGITASVLLPAKVPKIDLVIYERESDVGGVWHTNIYPGVRCDVPAHAYQATFEPSTRWSTAYAAGSEIKEYWKGIVARHGVDKYINLNSKVTKAEWSEEKAKWFVSVVSKDGTHIDEADFLVTGTGHFSDPRLPIYPGMDEFQGLLRHSSNWDPTFDPAGKRIAVIGNGASGLQVLPPLQKVAARVDHYARNKTWVAAPIGGENLEQFVTDRIEKARSSPEEYLKFRKELEAELFSRFGGIFKGGEKNNTARETITKLMSTRLGDRPDLLNAIIPDFAPNCRRLTPGPGYLEALTADNVDYVTVQIEKFTRTGIQTTDGIHREVDAIICSTGHDISFSTAFPVIANGVNLQTAWRPGGDPGFPDSYLSIAAPGFPNFLTLLGPNATGPAGTLTHSVENQVTYCARVLRKASSQRIRSMAPSAAATRDFRAYCESFFPRTVMSEYCSSWYNGGIKGGRIHGIWPGSGAHVNAVRRDPRWEDWEYTYLNPQGNRFAWLGNGWTTKDLAAARGQKDLDVDLTPWLQAGALDGNVDLRGYHEQWWAS